MKKISLHCAGLLVVTSLVLTSGASATIVFSEDFEGITTATDTDSPLALTSVGYVVENISGNNATGPDGWTHADVAWVNPAIAFVSADNFAFSWWDPANPNDDWLITPGFALTNGEDYFIEFDWADYGTPYPGTFQAYIGTTATSAGMLGSGTLLDDDGGTGVPTTSSSTFTATSTGTYFLAIRDDSPANGFTFQVDNIVVDTDPIGSGVDDWNLMEY